MKYKEKHILNALKNVIEPTQQKDVVSLNMIKNIRIHNQYVNFTIEFVSKNPDVNKRLQDECISAIHKYVDKDLVVNTSSRFALFDTDNLQKVKNIIAVASGKGGVGKSTIAVNLAVGLAQKGEKVGLIDADIYGPSVPMMFNATNDRPEVFDKKNQNVIIPIERYGVKLISIGFFIEQNQALVWRGPIASRALQQLFTDVVWGELDYLVIDLPPGTGDIQITLVQSIPISGVIIVSTPQNVALIAAEKGINMFSGEGINVPILGLVENMSYFIPPELPDRKYYIFGKEGCKKLAEKYKIPLLGEIPLYESVSESGDIGIPAVFEKKNPASKAFLEMTENVMKVIKQLMKK